MTDYWVAALLVAASYFVGSIPTGLLFARARGIEIRAVGSGNIGATNVARSLGKKLGLIVLVLDAVKGATPVAAALLLDLDTRVDPFVVTACGVAAVCGHCFPIWLGFRGGKGVATSLGVFLVVAPVVAGIGVALFAALYGAFRIASLGSLAAALSFPVLLWLLGRSDAVVTLAIAVAAVIFIQHRANIARLIRHREHTV